jgi:hypothetical protein
VRELSPGLCAQDLMQKYGITAEQAGEGSSELAWLLREKRGEGTPVLACRSRGISGTGAERDRSLDREASCGHRRRRARRLRPWLEIPVVWLREGITREQIAGGLRPLLEHPVEHVLAMHGGPFDRTALEKALA